MASITDSAIISFAVKLRLWRRGLVLRSRPMAGVRDVVCPPPRPNFHRPTPTLSFVGVFPAACNSRLLAVLHQPSFSFSWPSCSAFSPCPSSHDPHTPSWISSCNSPRLPTSSFLLRQQMVVSLASLMGSISRCSVTVLLCLDVFIG